MFKMEIKKCIVLLSGLKVERGGSQLNVKPSRDLPGSTTLSHGDLLSMHESGTGR